MEATMNNLSSLATANPSGGPGPVSYGFLPEKTKYGWIYGEY